MKGGASRNYVIITHTHAIKYYIIPTDKQPLWKYTIRLITDYKR